MHNISTIQDCYGCGVCTKACSKKLIHIRLNEAGFYEPYISDLSSCTECGLCLEVCSFSHDALGAANPIMASFAGWSNDTLVRRKCSSGGVAFEIAKLLLSKGFRFCGVTYNLDKQRAEHYIATTVEELVQSAGSKYLQSFTEDAFLRIDRRQKYLVTGTPCQMDSFRRYIKKFGCEENFILLDFFCHGVPSMLVWQKYLSMIEPRVGKITHVSWRNKQTGWHDSWAMAVDNKKEEASWHDSYLMLIRGKKSFYNSRLSEGDLFYKMFLKNACLGKACYDSCKYKMAHSSADIRVGDFWGRTYRNNEDGVSGVLAFTDRGLAVLEELEKESACTFERHESSVIMEGQMKVPAKRCLFWKSINGDIKTGKSLQYINLRYFYIIEAYSFAVRVINKLKKILT